MRTRNAETPKSGAKKTPPPKKTTPEADKTTPPADKTPETAPKSASGAKSAKKTTPKAVAAAATDTKPESKVAPANAKKPASTVKTPVKKATPAKKAGAKAKSPAAGKAPAVAKAEEAKAVLVPVPEVEMESKEDVKAEEAPKVEEVPVASDEPEAEPEKKEEEAVAKEEESDTKEEEADKKEEEVGVEEEPMEEDVEQEGDEMLVDEEGGEAAGEGEEEQEEEEVEEEVEEGEGAEVEDEVQIEISDMAKARKIKKEQEIFVGGLDRDAVEEDLKKVFEKVGEVVEVRLHKDFTTNKNKGFAFVKFSNKEQAAKALTELKNPMIRGKRCGIAPSEDNDTLFVGNICNSWTKEAIKRKLKDYGIDNVESITLVPDSQNEGLSRGFAFVEFSCHADAMLGYKRLQKPDAIFGHPERTAKVAFAEPLREPDPEVLAQIKSVFVDGLPPYWDEDRVKEQFKGFGDIERVVLARNMSTAKRKDFGFVNFTTHEAAVACIEGVNNTELGDGNSKMKARARLANPLPKTQAVKGGMSGGFRIGHTGLGIYSRFGRGFPRGGRYFPNRAGFQRGRSFNLRGRGRGGSFPFAADNMERSHSDFRGRRPFGFRGGRVAASARGGAFARGRGRAFPPRRQPYALEEDYGVPSNARHVGEDPYFYEGGHGVKRPFSMMEHDPGYLESGSRLRTRYDHPDSTHVRYRGSLGTTGLYSHDYYRSNYGSPYSSLYGGDPTGRDYYY